MPKKPKIVLPQSQKNRVNKQKSAKKVRTPKKTSLTLTMILGITIPLVMILSIVGVLLHGRITTVVEELKMKDINAQTAKISTQANIYFSPFFNAAKMLGANNSVHSLLLDVEKKGEKFIFQNSTSFNSTINELVDASKIQKKGLKAMWLASPVNSQVVTSEGDSSDKSFVITDRPWYQQVLNAQQGEVILTGAYEDFNTGELIVTAAVGVYEHRDPVLIGIVGMDIELSVLLNEFSSVSIGQTGYVTVFDNQNHVMYHPDDTNIMKSIPDMAYSQNLQDALGQRQDADAMIYTRDGVSYCGSVAYVENIGWTVLGCMPMYEFHTENRQTTVIIVGSFIFCALLLTGATVILSIAIVRPIRKLQNVTNHLASGDLDVDVSTKSTNEIGILANNISHLVDRLKTYILYINEISGVLDEIGQGNLVFSLQQDYVGEFNRLKVAMNEIQRSLSETFFQIVDSADQVSSGSVQIATGSQALAQGTTEQASTVEELSATVQDLTSHSLTDAKRAMELSKEIRNIGSQISTSNLQMQEMLKAMDNITHQSAEIGKIIKTIDDIAFQTNILALNAAVEAARAGSAGKGFAVVADEVRNLAGKSAEAAQSVEALINRSIAAVKQGSGIAEETAQSLSTVTDNVGGAVDAVEQFSQRYQQQTASLQQISDGINQISSVVQTNSATAEESAASSQELSSQAGLMKELTDQFHMDEKFHKFH